MFRCMEALINHGILGFVTFTAFCFSALFYSLKAIRDNPDSLSTFLAYFYIMLFVQLFTNGRPYEISFWHPFCLMIRFVGISHLYSPKSAQSSDGQFRQSEALTNLYEDIDCSQHPVGTL
jgi:hypothetical protein